MPSPQPLDPELAPTIEKLPPVRLDQAALPALRERQRVAAAVPVSDAVVRTDHTADGDAAVRVRVHRPAGVDGSLPCIVSLHGGGLVGGTHLTDDALFDRWCPALGVVGVSVDYRLAPEHPYPAALDDADAALAWTYANADALGVDRGCVGLRGLSAGAGIAAALALRARDRGGPAVAFQLLDAPMLDDRQLTPSSRQDGLPVWTREANAFAWRSYLGDLYGDEAVPHTAAAARATDLSGLPPTFVSVGSVDGFRDEAIDYAARLNQAGVPCELHVYAGAPHGYHLAGDTHLLRRAREDMERWLARTIRSIS
jgi:acetyl esterase/lipase